MLGVGGDGDQRVDRFLRHGIQALVDQRRAALAEGIAATGDQAGEEMGEDEVVPQPAILIVLGGGLLQVGQLYSPALGQLYCDRLQESLWSILEPALKLSPGGKGGSELLAARPRQVAVEKRSYDQVIGEALVGESDGLTTFTHRLEENPVAGEEPLACHLLDQRVWRFILAGGEPIDQLGRLHVGQALLAALNQPRRERGHRPAHCFKPRVEAEL